MQGLPQAPKAPAVLKAARLLAEVAQSADPLTSGDLARILDLPKSTVVDLCQTLANLGCLSREAEYQFLLGPVMTRVSRGLFGGYPLLETFYKAVKAVDRESDRTVIMAILDQADIAVAAVHHGRAVLPITAKVGLYLPAWTTASGYSLLSEHSADELQHLLERPSVTAMGVAGAVPSAEELFLKIDQQKRQGYFVDREQTAVGMYGVSAPLFLPGRSKPMAAITIATLEGSSSAAALAELGEVARRIAKRCVRLSAEP